MKSRIAMNLAKHETHKVVWKVLQVFSVGFWLAFVSQLAWFSVMNFADDNIMLQCLRIRQACRSEGLLSEGLLNLTRLPEFSMPCPLPRQVPELLVSIALSTCLLPTPVVPATGVYLSLWWENQLSLYTGKVYLHYQQELLVSLCWWQKLAVGGWKGKGQGSSPEASYFNDKSHSGSSRQEMRWMKSRFS